MDSLIQIRFNTEKDKTDASLPPWRVLVDGVEHLASEVHVEGGCWTSHDEISPGLWKWHITCHGQVRWDNQICRIQSSRKSYI